MVGNGFKKRSRSELGKLEPSQFDLYSLKGVSGDDKGNHRRICPVSVISIMSENQHAFMNGRFCHSVIIL